MPFFPTSDSGAANWTPPLQLYRPGARGASPTASRATLAKLTPWLRCHPTIAGGERASDSASEHQTMAFIDNEGEVPVVGIRENCALRDWMEGWRSLPILS